MVTRLVGRGEKNREKGQEQLHLRGEKNIAEARGPRWKARGTANRFLWRGEEFRYENEKRDGNVEVQRHKGIAGCVLSAAGWGSWAEGSNPRNGS